MADDIKPHQGADPADRFVRGIPKGSASLPEAPTRRPGTRQTKAVEEVSERLLAVLDVLQDTHSQIAALSRSQLVNDVLGVELVTFDSTGQLAREYRTQVGAVEVVNHSTTSDVTVSSAPPTVQPSGGKGVYRVGAGQRQVVHIGTHTVTLYGTSGQQVSFSAFTKAQPPAGGFAAPAGALLAPSATGSALAVNTLPMRPGTPLDTSGTCAAGSFVTLTLAGAAGVTTWVTGFELTWDATGTGSVNDLVTITGPTNQLFYKFATVAGTGGSLPVEFPEPIPASAVNTAITVGTGTVANRAGLGLTAHGFRA